MSDNQPTIPTPQRPYMPGYGVPVNPDGMLTWAWVDQQMAKSRNYWICSTRPDGRPHAAPVWGVWVDGVLYFGTGRESRKYRNLSANPAVAVHCESGDDAVMLEGTVAEVSDKDLLKRVHRAYAEKYPPYNPAEEPESNGLTYAVRARVIMAWQEQNFLKTPARWIFEL